MSFTVELLRGALPLAVAGQGFEILQLSGESGAKDRADFFRPGAVPFSGIDQLPAGPVGELDLGRDAVGKGQAPGRGPYRLGADPDGTGFEQEAEKVEEVAGFPEHPAAAFGMICEPAGGLERSGHDAEAGGLRSRGRSHELA